VSPKSFTALSLLTAAVLLAALVMIAGDRGDGRAAGVGEAAIPGLLQKANDAGKIIIEHADGKITLTSGEAGWVVKEAEGYWARSVKIKRSVLGLAQLILREPKTRLKKNFAKLELRDPTTKGAQSKRVRLFDKTGKAIGYIIVGKRRPSLAGTTGGGLYVRKPGQDQTWLAAGDADISRKIVEWLERKIVHLESKRVKHVAIRHPDGETVQVAKATPEETQFALYSVPVGKTLISQTEPTTIGEALEHLVLDDVTKQAQPLDPAKTITIDYTTFDELAVRVTMVKQDDAFWLKIEASGAHQDAAEITKRTKGWTYRIADHTASTFTRRMKDLVEDAKPKS